MTHHSQEHQDEGGLASPCHRRHFASFSIIQFPSIEATWRALMTFEITDPKTTNIRTGTSILKQFDMLYFLNRSGVLKC